MRWLINYFRQCVCKHEFETSECKYYNDLGEYTKIVVSMCCTKCGYHTKYSKY
jgi:hypothetical protein